jgi:hypothetical protein
MAGYPRVIGGRYVAGVGAGEPPPPPAMDQQGNAIVRVPPGHPLHPYHPGPMPGMQMRRRRPEPGPGGHPIHSPPWRAMNAPGSPPLGEGHVPIPMNPEAFNGTWGAGGGTAGVSIIFSARPQKPFKTTRVLVAGTKSGPTAIGRMLGQVFVGTDLQQGELGNIDLETLGAGGSFDTWLSLKQAEPGVWIRALTTLTAFPVAPDFEVYTLSAIGHYLH